MDRDLALRIQQNALRDWIGVMAESSPGAVLYAAGGVVADAAPACPERSIANSVTYRDAGELVAAHDALAAFYDGAGVEAWTVWVPEFDAETIAALEARGHEFDGKPLAMALELDRFEPLETGDLDWSDGAQAAEVGAINDAAYELDPAVGIGRALVSPPARYRMFVARVDGRAACVLGTIEHEPCEGGAGADLGFYFVATDARHRGKGLCSRLISAILEDARERGLATASLQASAMGEPIYRRLGLEALFRFHLYERRGG